MDRDASKTNAKPTQAESVETNQELHSELIIVRKIWIKS
jgi:hypothetical protein